MSWRLRMGRVAGINLYVHWTFFLLLAWVLLGGLARYASWTGAIGETLFVSVVFGTVVLHELGHALAARHYGIGTRDITLLPIGGVARLERMPEDPRQELVVALAGPAVNVAIALGLAAFLWVSATSFVPGLMVFPLGGLLARLFWVNVWLVFFNLLPAFPMDGGRVLRALLALRLDYVRATNIAAKLGKAMAIFFAVMGLFFNPMLLLVALFVWAAASQEAGMVQMRYRLGGIPVDRAMIRDFRSLAPQDTLRQASQSAIGYQRDFPVLEEGRLVGILSVPRLFSGLAQLGEDATVGEVMQRYVPTVPAEAMLEQALIRLQQGGSATLPVLYNGMVAGMLTLDSIQQLLNLQAALRAGQRWPAPGHLSWGQTSA